MKCFVESFLLKHFYPSSSLRVVRLSESEVVHGTHAGLWKWVNFS